ncbi:antA/AntB antirepressor family protein [Brucella pseudintermedia]|uniref:antA/AntB antirepressor family protein n=1 Tax=Brucella pseudintermedia TaxID=370111 RepID=UPI00366E8187|nr:antA/AntB antirepressor family protein [Brucella pseudintermedia]
MEDSKFPSVVKGQIGEGSIQTVNARDLHEFLEVGVRFNDWIARRIAEYGFEEGKDFYSELSKTSSGGRPSREYHISLDMAKELSMVERNKKGKQARQYFIECERRAKQIVADPVAVLNDPAAMRGLLLSYTEKVIELQSKVAEMQPAVAALEQIAEAHGSFTRTEAAKHIGIAPHLLCKWMTTNGWTYRRPGTRDDIAYQSKINAGYLEHKVTTGLRPDGTEWISTQVRVTPKGLTVLAKGFPQAVRAA